MVSLRPIHQEVSGPAVFRDDHVETAVIVNIPDGKSAAYPFP
jgi:hypothetical protein